jgi:hypothetical protein
MSQRKGASAEREVIALIEKHVGVKLERRLDQYRRPGHDLEVPRIATGVNADRLRRMAIEVKRIRHATHSIRKRWWAQTVEQAGEEYIPVLWYREDAQPWHVTVPLYSAEFAMTARLSPEGFARWVLEI